jgi:hypothetical protein
MPVRQRRRHGSGGDGGLIVPTDGTATLGHLVESVGVPLTEVGELLVDGVRVSPSQLAVGGSVVDVRPVNRPQRPARNRFLLDVHLGTLARRLRLVGVDAAFGNAADVELVAQASDEQRVLLTRDRGLLRRRALVVGAFVYAEHPDDQLVEVLDRFTPALAPLTRCPACNGLLVPATLEEVAHRLEVGTRKTYRDFARCPACDKVYWRGAHMRGLRTVLDRAARHSAG